MSPGSGEQLARALAAKDRDALRAVLADRVDFRGLTPGRHWEATTGDEVAAVFVGAWFEPGDEIVELLDVSHGAVGDRRHLSYRLRGRNDGGPFVVEQQAYYTENGEGIDWLRVLCSGFRPDSADQAQPGGASGR